MDGITFQTDLSDIDWEQLKSSLASDDFDNGRTPEQLRRSFESSTATVIACAPDWKIIGTARILSDGVCNAYLIDVWTLSAFRRRSIARRMIEMLIEPLRGQHVYLQADADNVEFYRKLGFRDQPSGMSRVVGTWLKNS